jgi:hypothetical protein
MIENRARGSEARRPRAPNKSGAIGLTSPMALLHGKDVTAVQYRLHDM